MGTCAVDRQSSVLVRHSMFHPSLETRKLGLLIYFFGSLGLLSLFPGPSPDISKLLPLPATVLAQLKVPGIMFYPTAYLTLLFVSNLLSEHSYFSLNLTAEDLRSVSASRPVLVQLTGEPRLIQARLVEQVISSNKYHDWAGYIRNSVEIFLPIVFGISCIILLWHSGVSAFVVLCRTVL